MTSATLTALAKRHPDKIKGFYKEPRDGYWIDLQPGWTWQECHAVHEWNIKDLLQSFKAVEPCYCDDFRRGK